MKHSTCKFQFNLQKQIKDFAFFFLLFFSQLQAQTNTAGYEWNTVKIGGGGFVSGIITCPQEKNLIYARTDVGGAYRWVEATKSWKPLIDWASKAEWTFFGVESLAIDPSAPNKLYLSVGLYGNSPCSILRSDDYGETFKRSDVSFQTNANGMGRNNGERLAVDPNNGQILFCGARAGGIWKSTDGAVTWTKVSSFPVNTTSNGNGVDFIVFDDASGNGTASQRIFVGVSRVGADNVYVSEDGGVTWSVISGEPTTTLMPQRGLKAGDYLYITYADAEGPWNPTKGAAYRYNIKTKAWKSIAPDASPYGGVTVDASNPDIIMLSTINIFQQQIWEGGTTYGDKIYRSTDGGTTWTNLSLGNHLKAEISQNPWIGTAPKIHWASDIRIDPFNSERVMINSGNGLFMTDNISATKSTWTFQVNGLEEMVALDMVSIPNGPFVSVIGDYNGFIHTDPTVSPIAGAITSNMGTTTGIDFAENNTNFVVVVGDKNCKYTTNQGGTWTAVSTLPVTTATKGNVAVSADGTTIYWYPENGANTYYTKDKGVTWKPLLVSVVLTSRPVTDRVNSNKVYSYNSSTGLLYICTFNSSSNSYASTTVSVGTGGNNIIRAVPSVEGDVWIPLSGNGLKHYVNGVVTAISSLTTCDAVGFGKAATGKSYPAIYIWGTPVGGVLGIHRSDDMGVSWIRINDDAHQFGGPGNGNFVMGDRNVYGRAYMSTTGRGIVFGEKTVTAGLFSPQKERSDKFYPNPASDMLYSREPAKQIEILGLSGGRLLETNESKISVGCLQNGCYIARLHTNEGVFNQIFIINK
jgi:xyloglucan-specific exo-beta-1,4-glucanase